jgi:large subunit ribosomal protein L21
MYAVIEAGGKQYRVARGMKLKVDKLAGDVGAQIQFDKVLLVSDDETLKVGRPYVEGSAVSATLVDQARDKKIIVFKKKRRKGYKRKQGHRQDITIVQIDDIKA